MGRKNGKKLAAISDDQEVESVGQNDVFRVFDMGRWKEAKLCSVCKRQFTWRKKWERCWGEVTTCSERCKQESKKEKRGRSDNADTAAHEVPDKNVPNNLEIETQVI